MCRGCGEIHQEAGNYIKELNGNVRNILMADSNGVAVFSCKLSPQSTPLLKEITLVNSKRVLRSVFLY